MAFYEDDDGNQAIYCDICEEYGLELENHFRYIVPSSHYVKDTHHICEDCFGEFKKVEIKNGNE